MRRHRVAGLFKSWMAFFNKKNVPGSGTFFYEWAIQDLNPGPSGYEPPALTN